jgi:hypothetical protein
MAVESGCPPTAILARPWRVPVPILLSVAVAVIAFAWLNHVNPEFSVTDDGVRDQLMARD